MRSASLETRHACAVPRTVAPYKYRATGDTVTKWERDVRGHLNKVGVGSAWSTIVTAQLATCPLHLEGCCCRMAEERKARHSESVVRSLNISAKGWTLFFFIIILINRIHFSSRSKASTQARAAKSWWIHGQTFKSPFSWNFTKTLKG